ncbi:MAG: hypothetical protein RMJ17_01990 [Candidatus Aenigmarchaeota archaeon]|nr:hypothetical protein [Candidatus Aenigmarchaeota archaeon]MDW8149346.1 hypothetical protein [Candidatus Aenigmarchaeota archaeon]
MSEREEVLAPFLTDSYIWALLFLLEFAPMDVLETILRLVPEFVRQKIRPKNKVPYKIELVVDIILKEIEEAYKYIPDNVDKEQLSYTGYVEMTKNKTEMKYRRILINKALIRYFVNKVVEWFSHNVFSQNFENFLIVRDALEPFPFSSNKFSYAYPRDALGFIPFYLGRDLRIFKNFFSYSLSIF